MYLKVIISRINIVEFICAEGEENDKDRKIYWLRITNFNEFSSNYWLSSRLPMGNAWDSVQYFTTTILELWYCNEEYVEVSCMLMTSMYTQKPARWNLRHCLDQGRTVTGIIPSSFALASDNFYGVVDTIVVATTRRRMNEGKGQHGRLSDPYLPYANSFYTFITVTFAVKKLSRYIVLLCRQYLLRNVLYISVVFWSVWCDDGITTRFVFLTVAFVIHKFWLIYRFWHFWLQHFMKYQHIDTMKVELTRIINVLFSYLTAIVKLGLWESNLTLKRYAPREFPLDVMNFFLSYELQVGILKLARLKMIFCVLLVHQNHGVGVRRRNCHGSDLHGSL